MTARPLSVPDLYVIEPRVFGDERGFFFESYNAKAFEDATGVSPEFVQDNHSLSQRGVLRGLHYQLPPKAQSKLVRVIRGRVFDVAVDIRASSPSFGRWEGTELSAENKRQLWIPEGFAHAFFTLSDGAEVLYKTTNFYAPDSEGRIIWNDPQIGIEWPLEIEPVLSEKDAAGKALSEAAVFP